MRGTVATFMLAATLTGGPSEASSRPSADDCAVLAVALQKLEPWSYPLFSVTVGNPEAPPTPGADLRPATRFEACSGLTEIAAARGWVLVRPNYARHGHPERSQTINRLSRIEVVGDAARITLFGQERISDIHVRRGGDGTWTFVRLVERPWLYD